MGLIIIVIILAGVVFEITGFYLDDGVIEGWKINKKQFLSLLPALLLIFRLIVTIPTGHTGIVTTFGRVENYVLDEGIHIKGLNQKIIKLDNRIQVQEINIQAFSSDIQQVDIICAVNFSVDRATSQNLYKNVGKGYYDTLMMPRFLECVKVVFAKYSAEDLVKEREILSRQIKEMYKPDMKEYGIEIVSVNINDLDFTDAYTNAVEAKQVSEQTKLQAAIEQTQKTAEATANAERRRLAADAEVMKYDKCPHCGMGKGFKIKKGTVITKADIIFDWDGKYIRLESNVVYKTTYFDKSAMTDEKIFCRYCNRIVCTYGEMFEED